MVPLAQLTKRQRVSGVVRKIQSHLSGESMLLFLQGTPGIGKSTLLRNALLPHRAKTAGFMVQRLTSREQPYSSYRACVIERAELPELTVPYEQGLSGIFLHRRMFSRDVLDGAILGTLRAAEKDGVRLIILDEIGGAELTSAFFMKTLERILSMGKPCAGVIKSVENLAGTAGRLGIGSDILSLNERLRSRIEAGGQVITMTDENRYETEKAVHEFVSAALGDSNAE